MIRIGIIGIGRMGISHHSILNRNDKVEICAIADISTFVMSLLKKYLKLKTFKNYDDLLNYKDLDAIIVATPPNFHFDILKKAADRNLHAFVEKPYTTSFEESLHIAKLFNEKQLINQVGYVNRFNDIFSEVRTLVKSNVIGDIIRFKSEMFSCTISQPDDGGSGWRGTRQLGGGAVYELASHAIDLVNYIVGKPDKVVGSSLNSIYSKNVEDAISSTFLYKNGCTGTIYINWSDHSIRKPTNKIEIFGSKGKILADQHSFKIFLQEPNDEKGFRQGWNVRYITDVFKNASIDIRGTEYTHQLIHFVECIENNDLDNMCSFNEGADTQYIISSIFIDHESNKIEL